MSTRHRLFARPSQVCRGNAIGVLALALLAGACAPGQKPDCPQGEHMAMETLYFGADRTEDGVARHVTDEEWRLFVDRVVTPLFPEGLTYWNASGQWKDARGNIAREPSYVLQIAHHPPGGGSERSIQAIVDRYKMDFGQQSVMHIRSVECVSFHMEHRG